MAGVLDNLQPQPLFRFFEELCAIPHGSGNCRAISDHLVQFAKDRKLEVIQDDALNVIIKKPGTKGYEDHAPVILQGHMDMVAVCTPESAIDMKTTPLQLMCDGEWISAKDTSLGGDDGVAVAMCMAILDAEDLSHPPLEVVITTEEETGMDGARELDASLLSGKRLINLDSEEEGTLLAGCAGGARFHAYLTCARENQTGLSAHLSVSGLKGGHSGVTIHEERGNANLLLARALHEIRTRFEIPFSLVSFTGGDADNAIPPVAKATLLFEQADDASRFAEALAQIAGEIANELAGKDPDVRFSFEKGSEETLSCVRDADALRALSLMMALPNGVQAMSAAVKGLVETSLNLGIVRLTEEELELSCAVRSSVQSAKDALLTKLTLIVEAFGARSEARASYPGWQYATDSPLRDVMSRVFEKQYGKTPVIEAIHAGVECGFFVEKIGGLDCISLGPDMRAIHSTDEALSVLSTARTYAYVCAVLREL